MKFIFILFTLLMVNNISYAQDYRYRFKADGIIYGEAVVPTNTAPSITTSAIDDGTTTIAYSFTMSATDAEGGPLSWSWSGDTPPGLNISSSGEISGTPSSSGVYNVSITVSDSEAASRSESFSINIFDLCETEPIGAVCSDGAIYVGNGDDGDRRYMRSTDIANVFWGLYGTDVIPGTVSDFDGEGYTNLITPTYDANVDAYRTGTAAQDCRALGSEWYVPTVNEMNLIVLNDSAPSSGTLKTNGGIQNTFYVTLNEVNANSYTAYSFVHSGGRTNDKGVARPLRCFRK